MSDTAQGPDWWLASDGKWYPPTSRPQPPPPPPAPPVFTPPAYGPPPYGAPTPYPYAAGYAPVPPFVAPRTVSPVLSGWMQGLLWAAGGLGAIGALLVLAEIGSFQAWRNGGGLSSLDAWNATESAFNFFSAVGSFVELALFVLFLVWANKCHKTAARLQPGPRKWSSGWTIGAWFIPFANVVMPKLVLDETERIATAARWNGQADPTWRTRSQPVSTVGWVWWISLIGMYVFGFASGSVSVDPQLFADVGRVNAGYVLMLVRCVLATVSAVFGVFYVRNISRALSPQAMAGLP